jgi:enoyl-[acyl-carrier-protein] reductase (NADH)
MYNLVICLIPAVLVLIGIRKLRVRSWGYCENAVSLNNKVAIVTGANSGIGYQIAKALALKDAHIILACRNIDMAKKTILKIEKQLKKSVKMVFYTSNFFDNINNFFYRLQWNLI